MAECFVGRKPVLDREKHIYGYELLVREFGNGDNPPQSRDASAVTLPGEGLEAVVGHKTAFVKFDAARFTSDARTVIPPEHAVFEVADTDTLGAATLGEYKRLKDMGYRLCLNAAPSGVFSPLVQMTEFVKLDARTDPAILGRSVQQLKKLPVALISTGVDAGDCFGACSSLGFSFFQGDFYAQPAQTGKGSVSPSQALMMELSGMLVRNEDVAKIESIFRKNPELTFGLLKLMNSAFFRVQQKITSIRHAIALLGYDNLQKWVALLLFSIDRQNPSENPLMEKVILRGRIMELLAQKSTDSTASPDSAFMTGILSLVNVLFGLPLRDIIEKLNIIHEIQAAVLDREGYLGTLLTIAERLDREDAGGAEQLLGGVGLSLKDLYGAETEAILEYQKWISNAQAGP